MELKHTVTTIFVVSYDDLQEFIAKTYGLDGFFFVEDQYRPVHQYRVKADPLDKWERAAVKDALADCCVPYSELEDVLRDLCHKGLILPGDYDVTVSN